MSRGKKKPLSVTLSAALILCIITFIIGILIPSVFLLDSRIKSANEEIDSLKATVSEQKKEISSLNASIEQKDAANITLGETISEHLITIDQLKSQISDLEGEVEFAAEAAVTGISSTAERNQLVNSMSNLSSQQLLIILSALFVLLIFIISVTCGVIATSKKNVLPAPTPEEEKLPPAEIPSFEEEEPLHTPDDSAPASEEEAAAPEENDVHNKEKADEGNNIGNVASAIEALYNNTLEDSYSSLGGFLFGITNYDDILNDTAKGKSFGNSDSGDFVAFMDSTDQIKKLYIIPRYMSLSDSTVTLRGMTDLFNIFDESANEITHGSVKIKSVDSPAVFAFGKNGWAIESKGIIQALESPLYQN